MNRVLRDLKGLIQTHKEKFPYVIVAITILVFYTFSKSRDATTYVYKAESRREFKEGRVLGFQEASIYEGKERLFSKTVRDIQSTQSALKDATAKIEARLSEIEKAKLAPSPTPLPSPMGLGAALATEASASGAAETPVRASASTNDLPITGSPTINSEESGLKVRKQRFQVSGRGDHASSGASILSFPVKEMAVDQNESVAVPAGSYVKAKLMTGVEAPEGKTYPVLLQLDYAYIVPNKHRIDLSGCFMIAKSQGDISTERVQMQATKLSCVSKEGRMFERDVNGFIADDKDNSFAVTGSVNSKQDRVAAMAFLSSIVEGVGKAVGQAQTTQQTTPLGGSQSVMTGSGAEYLAAGGASNAASMVTQWYLRQAQNLLPTINIGSGRDVWVVMQESVKLPNEYFKKALKGGVHESPYSYLSRVLD